MLDRTTKHWKRKNERTENRKREAENNNRIMMGEKWKTNRWKRERRHNITPKREKKEEMDAGKRKVRAGNRYKSKENTKRGNREIKTLKKEKTESWK